MSVKYNKLFDKISERKMTPRELIEEAKCSANILTHLKNNEYISMASLEKICSVLNCGVDDVLEFQNKNINENPYAIKVVSLFSGIGGFEEGLKMAGVNYRVVFASEIDAAARKSYATNFDSTNLFGDITKMDEKMIPDHDLLLAGFPCQSFSIAGKRKGFEDIRGTLFFDVARILNEKKPKYVLLENVKNLISHDQSRTVRKILSTLNDIGYTVDFTVINSSEAGVPQNRDRTYICGIYNGTTKKFDKDIRSVKANSLKEKLNETDFRGFNFFNDISFNNVNKHMEDVLECEVSDDFYYNSVSIKDFLNINHFTDVDNYEERIIKLFDLPREIYNDLERQRRVYSVKGISPTVLARSDSTKIFVERNGEKAIRKITAVENFYMQGFGKKFVDNIKKIGTSKTQMYKQSGNAVSPPVIEGITKKLIYDYLMPEKFNDRNNNDAV
ncbi:DNA (cytosine-5-)-methyltransferase [Sharpea azabuensis]|uniref:Cytosine-specific methyltransferase n=1 Tax=Sharpea azabuensis TaxID=322505 RepID=A0A1H6RUH6_9FIRM|nr:DNA (cytosine-5-)-methyltransferase [Sharpea azabuensis]SEI55195.1 DNA (cytosine-5)-methyltransferase 1 [Sharpea azabuensis]